MEPKLRSKEQAPNIPPQFPGIVLDANNLAKLALMRMAGVGIGAKGVCISNSRIAQDERIGPLIEQLSGAGAKVKQDMPKHAPFGGGATGSTVLYFPPDLSTSELGGTDADMSQLDALLGFYTYARHAVNSITITPNMAATKKLKGVEVQFDPRVDKWWQIAGRMPWSFGRGVAVVSVPIDINMFLDRVEYISAEMYRIARIAYPAGAVQHINLAISPDNQVILELAAGLSNSEAKVVGERLTTTNKSKIVEDEMKNLQIAMRERRIQIATSLAQAVAMGDHNVELLAQGTHTYLNTEMATMGSGIIHTNDDPSSWNPMVISGSEKIILLDQHQFQKIPVGLPHNGPYQAILPPNMEKRRKSSKKIEMPKLNLVTSRFMDTVIPAHESVIIAAPFHKGYTQKEQS
jgi:hypothetical protein